MNLIQSIILGVVEGVTEFLPISSTGHLILSAELLGLSKDAYVKTFEIAIQSGAIFSVVLLYWRQLLNLELIKRVMIAFFPTAVIGLLLYGLVKNILLNSDLIVLSALLIGGIALIAVEFFLGKANEDCELIDSPDCVSYRQSFIIGCAQALAVIPGVSRSAASIVGARLIGVSRQAAAEFSFFLAIPTILVATIFDLKENIAYFSYDQISMVVVGFFVSLIVAVIVIKMFIGYVRRHSFIAFGVYRILAAIVMYLVLY